MADGVVRELLIRIGFPIDQASAGRAQARINGIRAALLGADRQGAAFASRLASITAGLLGVAGAAALVRSVVSATAEYERMIAILEVLEGSAEGAARTWEFISDIALEQPSEIDQIADAYMRLRGAALPVTRDVMNGLGNMAAVYGRTIDEIVRGGQQAARGMPRLLEGILRTDIRTEARHLSFMFQGEMVRIERSAESVIGWLTQMGNTRFAGAMARQMGTLIGAWSLLGDAWKAFARTIGTNGMSEGLIRVAEALVEVLGRSDDLGVALGGAARAVLTQFADAILWVGENVELLETGLDVLRATLVALVGRAVIQGVIRLFAAIASGAAMAALPVLLLNGLLLAIPLLLEDFIGFMQGRPSLIGHLLGKENAPAVRGFFNGLIANVEATAERILEIWDKIVAGIGVRVEAVRFLWEHATNGIVTAFRTAGLVIGRIMTEWTMAAAEIQNALSFLPGVEEIDTDALRRTLEVHYGLRDGRAMSDVISQDLAARRSFDLAGIVEGIAREFYGAPGSSSSGTAPGPGASVTQNNTINIGSDLTPAGRRSLDEALDGAADKAARALTRAAP